MSGSSAGHDPAANPTTSSDTTPAATPAATSGADEPMVFAQQINVPYTYTAGRTEAAFLRALAEHRILGVATDDGVLVPARPFAPDGSRTGDLVEVADTGTVRSWTVRHHGDAVTTFGLVRLDGADSDLLHLLDVPEEDLEPGLRVRARWADGAGTEITAIEAFVPA